MYINSVIDIAFKFNDVRSNFVTLCDRYKRYSIIK